MQNREAIRFEIAFFLTKVEKMSAITALGSFPAARRKSCLRCLKRSAKTEKKYTFS